MKKLTFLLFLLLIILIKVGAVHEVIDSRCTNSLKTMLRNEGQEVAYRFSKVKIRYIGAIISPEKIILQEKVFLKACRSARRISRKGKITVYDARKMLSYAARFSHFDAHKAYIEKINSKVPKAKCRKIVSRHERRKNRCGINQVQP